MAAQGGQATEPWPNLSNLIKELSASQAREELQRAAHLPKVQKQIEKHLTNVAFSQLLGLKEDNSYQAEETIDTDDGIAAARSQLEQDGYLELSERLASLVDVLHTCTSCSVLGTEAQLLTDKPPTTPLTEHTALLQFLMSLQGSRPSVRRRQASFQYRPAQDTPQHETLRSSTFAEAPYPEALFEVSGTALLLPEEMGVPPSVVAGTEELTYLSQGMAARPTWAPAAAQGLPPMQSGGWFPVTPALMEMRGDLRRAAPPPPLNIPLASLAMDKQPGSITAFHTQKGSGISTSKQKIGSKDGAHGPNGSDSDEDGDVTNGVDSTTRHETLLGSGSLWTLEEAELARDALLSLQGVHSSLLRLRGTLAAAHALSRPATAGVLKKIEEAASCRQRLQMFIGEFSAPYAAARMGDGASSEDDDRNTREVKENSSEKNKNSDLVLTALAAGLEDVLLSISQQLSSLETAHATEWVAGVRLIPQHGDATMRGKVLKGHGLSITRVAVLTGRVQSMLRVLSSLCWCSIVQNNSTSAGSEEEERCEWQVTPPPEGPALLSVLCQWVETADEQYRDVMQYLFARAAQPYIAFLRQWAFTITDFDPGHPYVIPQSKAALVIRAPAVTPPSGPHRRCTIGQGRKSNAPASSLIPGTLPGFLAHLEAPLLNAGAQLRLLHSVTDYKCRDVTAALCSGENADGEFITGQDNVEGLRGSIESRNSEPRWMRLGVTGRSASALYIGNPGDTEGVSPEVELALGVEQVDEMLQRAKEEGERKLADVKYWLLDLEEEREDAAHAAKELAAGAAAHAAQVIIDGNAARAEALTRRQSVKAALLQEQREAIAAVQLARLNAARGGNGSTTIANFKGTAAAEHQITTPPNEALEIPQSLDLSRVPATGNETSRSVATARRTGSLQPISLTPSTIGAIDVASTPLQTIRGLNPNENGDAAQNGGTNHHRPASVSAASEAVLGRAVHMQYLAVSSACVGLMVDHLQLMSHLSFLRRAFFWEAGDWGEEFLGHLASRVTALQPLTAYTVHVALQDALRSSSLEMDPLAANLQADVLSGPTAISSFLLSLEGQGGPAAATLPRARAVAPLLVSPNVLDGLDCVLLRYSTTWPLSAILSEDTAVAYSAVFSAMLRVRRVAAALRRLRLPLAPRPAQAPLAGLSSTGSRRIQQLRVFVYSASQVAAAVQHFQGLTTSGSRWKALEIGLRSTSRGSKGTDPTDLGAGEIQSDMMIRSGTNRSKISDLQELLQMHRDYVAGAAGDCLTFCGRTGVQQAAETALTAALDVASKVEHAVESGRTSAGMRYEEGSWMREVEKNATWEPIAAKIAEFNTAAGTLREELAGVGSSGPLSGLASVLRPMSY